MFLGRTWTPALLRQADTCFCGAGPSAVWHVACGILVPLPGIKPVPPAYKLGVLTTGPKGKSQCRVVFFLIVAIFMGLRRYFNVVLLCIPLIISDVCSVAQSCPTLCGPMDCSPPGSSVHGIFQARILERVAISFSRRSSRPRDRILRLLHWQVDSLPAAM